MVLKINREFVFIATVSFFIFLSACYNEGDDYIVNKDKTGGVNSGLEEVLVYPEASVNRNSMEGSKFEIDPTYIKNLMDSNYSQAFKIREDTDNIGHTHRRSQQYYKGIKVIGGEMIEHFKKNGELYHINGKVFKSENFSTKAKLDNNDVFDVLIDIYDKKDGFSVAGEPKLVIYAGKLAYKLYILFYKDENIKTLTCYIDAGDGKLLISYDSSIKNISGNRLIGEGGENVSFVGTSIYIWWIFRWVWRLLCILS